MFFALSLAAWSNLKRACKGNDLPAIRSALIAFIETHSAGSRVNGLSRFQTTDDTGVWQRLNEGVFGASASSGAISAQEVLRAAAQLRKRVPKAAAEPLPALYS